MAELHVISALRDKRSALAGMVRQLEQQLAQQRSNLAHVDATMLLFDPDIRPSNIRPRQQRQRDAWFRPGECLRLIYTPCSAIAAGLPIAGAYSKLRCNTRGTGVYRRSRASADEGKWSRPRFPTYA